MPGEGLLLTFQAVCVLGRCDRDRGSIATPDTNKTSLFVSFLSIVVAFSRMGRTEKTFVNDLESQLARRLS